MSANHKGPEDFICGRKKISDVERREDNCKARNDARLLSSSLDYWPKNPTDTKKPAPPTAGEVDF
jgi:hypothetical protein